MNIQSTLPAPMAEMKKARISAGLSYSGSSTWARTRDLRINSPALYQLSYRGIEGRMIYGECKCVKNNWGY